MASIFRRVPSGHLRTDLLYGTGAAQSITREFFEGSSGAASATGALATASATAPGASATGKASASGTLGTAAATSPAGVGSAQAHAAGSVGTAVASISDGAATGAASASASLPTTTSSTVDGSADHAPTGTPGDAAGEHAIAYAFPMEGLAEGLGTRQGGTGGGKPAPYVLPHTLRGLMARRVGEASGEMPTARATPLDGFGLGGEAKVSAVTASTRAAWVARLVAGRHAA